MQDAHSVITFAAKGHVEEIAKEMEVSLGRMYEILAKDNPYPKSKKLIRRIGKFNTAGVRLIKADMMAMFDEILGVDALVPDVSTADMHKELFDVMDATLRDLPPADCKKEIREAIAVLEQKYEGIEKLEQRNGLSAA